MTAVHWIREWEWGVMESRERGGGGREREREREGEREREPAASSEGERLYSDGEASSTNNLDIISNKASNEQPRQPFPNSEI
jgi:hypothetical protein